jgi:hypothetical protein
LRAATNSTSSAKPWITGNSRGTSQSPTAADLLPHAVEIPDQTQSRRRCGTTDDTASALQDLQEVLGGVLRRFAHAHTGRYVHTIGKPIWSGRAAHDYPASAQHVA